MFIQKIILLFFVFLCGATGFTQNFYDGKESVLTDKWDLNDAENNRKGLFVIKQYEPVYVLLTKVSNDVNKQPQSDGPDNSLDEPIDYSNAEMKFQLSMKTKVVNNLLGAKTGGDLWMAYTQSSYWQMYSPELSRPFRENNYQPELMFILPVRYRFLGMQSAFMGIGITHQSNGRGIPLSRSWNRVVAQFAWEGKHTSLVFKPWLRLSESTDVDDNPGIENYMGRGELLFAYGKGRHDFSCRGRHSLRFGDNNRGSIQINYAIRVWDHLKFRTQIFSGYGESMIDYNHRQTSIGFGVSLIEWR